MAYQKERVASDPQMASSIPPSFIRHHRRSVDRVWPPALEVRIARLSMDEGSSHIASIIPAPPTLETHVEDQDDVHTNDGLEMIVEQTTLLGNKAVAAAFRWKENEALKASGSGSKSKKERRRGSIMGPLSPSTHLEIEHTPHIDVRYNKQQRSHSKQGQGDYFNLLHHHRNDRPSARNSNSNSSDQNSSDSSGSMKNSAPDLSAILPPGSAHKLRSCSVVYTESPNILDTNEFGDDLFGKQHTMDLGSSTISIDSPYITDWVESTMMSTGLVVESPLTNVPTLHEPPLERPHPHRHPEYHEVGPQHIGQNLFPADYTFGGSSSRILSEPLVASPMKKPKNPLSAASSRSVSPLGLAPSRSPASKRSRSPLGKLSLNTINENSASSRGNGIQASGLRIHSTLMERDSPSSPRTLDLLPSEEQDRWKSPTLSALASPVLSEAHARGRSSPGLQPRHARQHSHNGSDTSVQSVSGRNHVWPPTFKPREIEIEIPSIEAHDEIPLQDIWRMEDEERKDRLAAGAVGEQHAHEEARLIQEVIQADPA